jgi:hypothetical protein
MEWFPSLSNSGGKGFITNDIPRYNNLPGRRDIKEQSLLGRGKTKMYSSNTSLGALTIVLRLAIH